MSQKLALCVGINAYGHGSDLNGCVNDANDWEAMLQSRGYAVSKMTDELGTKQNIVAGLKDNISKLKRGDQFVFQYSGHGTYVPDEDGDEQDARDEAICPVDIWDNQYIVDDELYELFNDRAVGSRVLFISDSCHSGTVNRFMPITALQEPEKPKKVRFLPPQTFLAKKDWKRVSPLTPPRQMKSSAALLAGCRDFEYSYDAWFGDRANGAFSRVAIDVLYANSGIATPRDLFEKIREKLPSQVYPQSPQIVGTSAQRKWKMFGV